MFAFVSLVPISAIVVIVAVFIALQEPKSLESVDSKSLSKLSNQKRSVAEPLDPRFPAGMYYNFGDEDELKFQIEFEHVMIQKGSQFNFKGTLYYIASTSLPNLPDYHDTSFYKPPYARKATIEPEESRRISEPPPFERNNFSYELVNPTYCN